MVNEFQPRYDYDQPRGGENDLVEKLDPESIDEFKLYLSDLENKIKEQFGPPSVPERLRFDKINNFISDMAECRVLALLVYSDHATKNTINFTKKSSKSNSGEEALIQLKIDFSDKLKLPWMRRMNLFDYPFDVEYKTADNDKYVSMTMEFRKGSIVAKYRLLIRGVKKKVQQQNSPGPQQA